MNELLSQAHDWQQQIRDLQERNRHAFLVRDFDTLEALWADELLVNSPVNRVQDKRQVLELLRKGVILHSSFEEHIEIMTRRGDLVTVMGRDVVVDAPGSPAYGRRFTQVWRSAGDSWRLIVRHANRIAAHLPGDERHGRREPEDVQP